MCVCVCDCLCVCGRVGRDTQSHRAAKKACDNLQPSMGEYTSIGGCTLSQCAVEVCSYLLKLIAFIRSYIYIYMVLILVHSVALSGRDECM